MIAIKNYLPIFTDVPDANSNYGNVSNRPYSLQTTHSTTQYIDTQNGTTITNNDVIYRQHGGDLRTGKSTSFRACWYASVDVLVIVPFMNLSLQYGYCLEKPPPLPSTLPPVGSQQIRHSTTSYRTTTAAAPNKYNNNINNLVGSQLPQATVRTTTWHQHYNNGNSSLNAAMLTNNDFLNNERAASSESG